MNPPEFAETYTRAERIRFALAGLVLGALGLAVWKLWMLPWVAGFADTAPCRAVFGVRGTTALWFGLFVGLPALLAALFAVALGRPGLAVLREGRYPPRGTKVFQPTRVRHGAAARWIGYLHVLAWTPLLAMAIWGYGQAAALSRLKGTTRCPTPSHAMAPALDRPV
ncbi:MAG TPA: hypothetical protein VFH59_05890 [Frateuria sp.]|uniref:hypothetical protein n=1 Tax=Frateuria sp. TaxID=2211372 RepID=UPI002D7F7B98|nr:hypothetical protein [Frateuria sp.]HET6804961.1 hypothetical protein [Frateuria sp.]